MDKPYSTVLIRKSGAVITSEHKTAKAAREFVRDMSADNVFYCIFRHVEGYKDPVVVSRAY